MEKNLLGSISIKENPNVAMCSLCGGGSDCSCGSCGVCNCGSASFTSEIWY